MNIPADIFNTAIQRLRSGEDADSICESYPQHAAELEQLLPIASLAMHIPKLQPPTPYKQYKFAEQARILPFRFANLFSFAPKHSPRLKSLKSNWKFSRQDFLFSYLAELPNKTTSRISCPRTNANCFPSFDQAKL